MPKDIIPPVSRVYALTTKEVTDIKKLLWNGTLTQWQIGEKFEISQGMVSHILWGRAYPEVPWPNKQTGSISPLYLKLLRKKTRRSGRRPRGV